MANYILEAHIPYDHPDTLFHGTEEELREFIRKNTTKHEVENKHSKKGYVVETKVCGYKLYDLSITIEGPDIKEYLDG